MGQKTNPVGLRLGINRSWDSKWFTSKHTAEWLEEDIKLRRYVKKRLARAGVSKIEVERRGDKVKVHEDSECATHLQKMQTLPTELQLLLQEAVAAGS